MQQSQDLIKSKQPSAVSRQLSAISHQLSALYSINFFFLLLKLSALRSIKRFIIHHSSFIIFIVIILFFSSCNVNRFLVNEQYIINSNKIIIQNLKNKRDKQTIEKNLVLLYRQKELPTFIVGHSKIGAWNYFKVRDQMLLKNKSKWLNRALAKTPTFYDKNLTELTVQNMRKYLKNAGYLYNNVHYEKDFHGRDKGLADMTYIVNPGTLYVYDTVRVVCADTIYQKILDSTSNESLLYRGQPVSANVFEGEKTRITQLFNNLGYARFSPNSIQPPEADTTLIAFDALGNRLVSATMTIQLPSDKSQTQQFINGEISVYPNYDVIKGETIKYDSIIANKVFFTYDGNLGLNAPTLARVIPLQPFGLYRQKTSDDIFKKISSLGLYKFISIKPLIDECDSNSISYKIYLTPNKKMITEVGAELYYSNISYLQSSGTNLGRLGVSGSINYTHRNLFKGAERYTMTLSGGVDFGLQSPDTIKNGKSLDFKFDNRLLIPKFINPSKTWQLYSKIGLLRKNFYNEIKENGQSEVSLSYILSDRILLDLYRLEQFNAGFRYILNRTNDHNERFTITTTSVELNLGTLTNTYRAKLPERTIHSFDSTLVSGILFRSFTQEYSTKTNLQNTRWRFLYTIQQSGSEVWLIDKLRNSVSSTTNDALHLSSLGFAKFWSGDGEARYGIPLSTHLAYALRISGGIATPFADAKAVPYNYQFYVGGPNSIRAWQQRSIGPGSFNDVNNKSPFPSQTGEIKLDFNSELRFDLFSRLKSAIFLDAGNVWNLQKDDKVPGGEFTKFWYDQLAVGTGIGLRLDLTYFIFRLDLGWKLRNPYTTNGNYWIPLSEYSYKNNSNLNFAIGLPF